MRSLWSIAATLILAACPKGASNTGPAVAGAGCPSGRGVFVASYVQQEPSKGRSGWVIPLHAVQATGSEPDYANVDPAAASAAGVPAVPTGTMWLTNGSGEPCKATAGKLYAAKIPGEGSGAAASISYGFEVEGCGAPSNPDEGGGILLVSEAPPTGCRFEAPQPVAARLGEMDAQKQWQRPTKETPIPPALAALVPEKECAAPACEKLWAFAEVKIGEQTVAWTGAVNWLAVGDPAQQCTWPAERFSGFFVPSGGGVVKITEGQTNPIVLSAVLADGGGAKVLLAEGPGMFATYDVTPSGAAFAHSASWMIAPPDAWEAVDHIGPICDPPR